MKPISEVHFRVCDHGLFLPVARRLARDAAKVSYWTPNERAFPTVMDCIGDGCPDVQRVQSVWQQKESVDCWVFPDIGFSDMQHELLEQGFPVWGARHGDSLEISRGKFIQALKQCDLPVAPYEKIEGMDALRDYLKDKEDLYLKISRFRGDWETLHWRSLTQDGIRLEEKAARFGPFSEQMIFYCFSPINTEIEDGVDTWCIQGQCPDLVIHGMEAKDQAYLGTFQRYGDLPKELRCVADAFTPILQPYNYRGFFSTEVRITKEGESFFIDPTLRAGSPPSQIMTEMIGNYADVIWGGANGLCVEPEPAAKFGVQAALRIKGDRKGWIPIECDDELDRWLKVSNCVYGDGIVWLAPDPENDCLQWITGIGDKLEEAIFHLKHNISLLPEGVSASFEAIADLLKEVEEAESNGMPLTDDKIPEPAIVIEEK